MNVSIGDRWQTYIEDLLKEGRYGSASEVVREGLRLVEEREQKLASLRETIQASIARGGSRTLEDIDRAIAEEVEALKAEGY